MEEAAAVLAAPATPITGLYVVRRRIILRHAGWDRWLQFTKHDPRSIWSTEGACSSQLA